MRTKKASVSLLRVAIQCGFVCLDGKDVPQHGNHGDRPAPAPTNAAAAVNTAPPRQAFFDTKKKTDTAPHPVLPRPGKGSEAQLTKYCTEKSTAPAP